MHFVNYKRMVKKWGVWPLVMLAALVGSQFVSQRPDIAKPSYLHVRHVVDGDTLKLSDGRKVRLIGVDTPESHESNKLDRIVARTGQSKHQIMAQGKKASHFTQSLVQGNELRLEFDPANIKKGHKDVYGRLLAYVYVLGFSEPNRSDLVYREDAQDGRMVFLNASLLKAGYAESFRKFPYAKKMEFFRLERQAKTEKRGLWS